MLYVCTSKLCCKWQRQGTVTQKCPPLKTVPQSGFGKCLLNRSHPNLIRWYMAEIRILAWRTWRGTGYGNHSAIQNTVHGYQKWQKGANNGLVGAASRGMNTVGWLQRHVITPCNVEQAVCAVPWCQGQASSMSGRGGPVWSMQIEQWDHCKWWCNMK